MGLDLGLHLVVGLVGDGSVEPGYRLPRVPGDGDGDGVEAGDGTFLPGGLVAQLKLADTSARIQKLVVSFILLYLVGRRRLLSGLACLVSGIAP